MSTREDQLGLIQRVEALEKQVAELEQRLTVDEGKITVNAGRISVLERDFEVTDQASGWKQWKEENVVPGHPIANPPPS